MLYPISGNTGFTERADGNSFFEKLNRRLMKITDPMKLDKFRLKGRERRMRNQEGNLEKNETVKIP